MIATYGGDPIAEYWRGQRSLRQLRVLIQHLPPDGALARSRRGHAWSDTHYLLANVVDAVQFGTYALAGVQGAKPKKPRPQLRPDDQQRHRQRTGDRAGRSTADVVAALDQLKPAKTG